MVFEFDYVPLAIGGIGQYAPGVTEPQRPSTQTEIEYAPLETEPVSPEPIAPETGRLDLNQAIPVWNADPKTIQNEIQSPLLRLPAELKLKIWAMAYEDVAIHMCCTTKGNIGHIICDEDRTAFHQTDPDICSASHSHVEYLQCRCRGSLLEPPYQDAPHIPSVKYRREGIPFDRSVPRIGGMLLACREIYANARDCLWTQPNFVMPTQRMMHHFASKVEPALLCRITKLTLHTWFDSWRTMAPSGFFGGCSDRRGPVEWEMAYKIIAEEMPALSFLHLVVHVSGGDSTVWYPECRPAACVMTLDKALWTNRAPAIISKLQVESEATDLDELRDDPDAYIATVKSLVGPRLPGMRCVVTAAVESSRHRPQAPGSWITFGQMKKGADPMRAMLRERNMQMLSELELKLPAGWELAWWVSLEERDKGEAEAGPRPWPFNHLPL